jgi:hypothetical protein
MSDTLYTVQRIISHQVVKGETLYHVAWKGYSLKEATWEPISSFVELDVIHRYWANVNDAKTMAKKKAEKAAAKAERDAIKQAEAAAKAIRVAQKKTLAKARANYKLAKRSYNNAIRETNEAGHEYSILRALATRAAHYASEQGCTDVQSFIESMSTLAKEWVNKREQMIASFPQHRANVATAKETLQYLVAH